MGFKNKDRIVYGVTLIVFAFVLWQLYYSLQLSFLAKSASILVSGIILLALYGLLMKEAKINCIKGKVMKKHFSLMLAVVTVLFLQV